MKTVQRIGWIIKNSKKSKIWRGTFSTKYEADAELRRQISSMPQGHTGANWKVEEFVYVTKAEKDSEDDFKDFN